MIVVDELNFRTSVLSLICFRTPPTSSEKMPSFEHELELGVSAAAMWAAMKDQNTILPKLMPEAIASIENVEGEGGPGSLRVVKFGPSKLN